MIDRVDAIRRDDLRVVGLAERDRQVVDELHVRPAHVDQLEVLRQQRAHVGEAVDRPLVHGHHPVALRLHGVAVGGGDVADVVVHRQLLDQLHLRERPLRDLRLDEHRRVGVALVVEDRVQGAEPELDLALDRLLEVEDRNAVGILAHEVLGVDQRLDLREVEDGGVRVELAAHDHVLAVRGDVGAVRALRLGHEGEHALGRGGLERDHREAVDRHRLAGLEELLGLLPVDDVQVVHVVLRGAGLERRLALQVPAVRALGVERVHEGPAVAVELARVGEVLHVGRRLDRERLLGHDAALGAVELPERDRAAVLLVVLLDRRVAAAERGGILRAFDHVLGVRRDERRAVVRLEDRVRDDLRGGEVGEVDHRHARVGLVTDEQELPVVVAVRLRQVRVVGVPPAHDHAAAVAAREHAPPSPDRRSPSPARARA